MKVLENYYDYLKWRKFKNVKKINKKRIKYLS